MSTNKQLIVAAPIRFSGATAAGAAKGRRFSGVAYGGGVITDHGGWDAVAFDLAGLKALQLPMPLLLQHDPDRAIGVIDRIDNDGRQLLFAGTLFPPGVEPEADRVAAKADAGMPYQVSVGIFADAIESSVPARAIVNGRPLGRAADVFRKSRVREASFVALGADSSTRATVFGRGPRFGAASEPTPKQMAEAREKLAERVAELERELAELRESSADLQALVALLKREKELTSEKNGEKNMRESVLKEAREAGADFAGGPISEQRLREVAKTMNCSTFQAYEHLHAQRAPTPATFAQAGMPAAPARPSAPATPARFSPEAINAIVKRRQCTHAEAFAYLSSLNLRADQWPDDVRRAWKM